jgi:hypothetical protein
MDGNTPVTLPSAGYSDRGGAVADLKSVWDARMAGGFDHTAAAVLTKDAWGRLQGEQPAPSIPGKGWFVILRLRNPLRSFSAKTWRSSEIQPV